MSPLADLAPPVCLVLLLAVAFRGPTPRIEAAAAVAAVAVVLALGSVTPAESHDTVVALLPVLGFLVAMLVVAELCQEAGLFRALGALLRDAVPARRLLPVSFVIAAVVTAVLNLDATVLLLTPVLLVTAGRLGRAGALLPARMANSASLFLPVSNLSNLLALPLVSLSFAQWALVMAPVGLAVLVVEYVGLRLLLHRDRVGAAPAGPSAPTPPAPLPVVPLVVVALMLVAFGVAGVLHIPEYAVATGAAVVLLTHRAREHGVDVRRLVASGRPGFAAYVLGLGVVVTALGAGPAGDALGRLVPGEADAAGLVLLAVLATVLANLLNNLPAALLLLPLAAPLGDGAVLACLVGLNAGAGLTYTGSLANLLWLRTVRAAGDPPSFGDFHRVGFAITPVAVVAGALVLALTTQVL